MSKDIWILGIHDGHNCGAALCKNGEIVAAVCEERLTRTKNEVGFPTHAIEDVLRIVGICGGDLEFVCFASFFMHSPDHLRNIESWYAVGSVEQERMEAQSGSYDQVIFEHRKQARINQATELLNIPESRVRFVEHHTAHLAAAYHTSPYPCDSALGITCDGAGDGLSVTVSICRNGKFERVAETDRHASLGKIYSRVTFMMGMKPWEDEYKVMGLAPYADQVQAERMTGPLRSLLNLRKDGLGFGLSNTLSTNYCYEYLCDSFQRTRFDLVAGAMQLFTEDMMVKLVRNVIEYTGVEDVVCGGGVFMNVKANMRIAALPEVRTLYVMPSAADESLAIGACLYEYARSRNTKEHGVVGGFSDLYLGGDFTAEEEESAIKNVVAPPFTFHWSASVDDEVVDIIRSGGIVARCKGRMEWGARALGNRSILCRADRRDLVGQLNQAIKRRDFWMPFAPTIIEEVASRYFDDPKHLRPYFMTQAFNTKESTRADIVAAVHPYDYSTRPQVVTRAMNPEFYEIVYAVGGAVLNTSFNLHGYPIVYSPTDAVEVFLNSGLEYLAMNSFILKKGA